LRFRAEVFLLRYIESCALLSRKVKAIAACFWLLAAGHWLLVACLWVYQQPAASSKKHLLKLEIEIMSIF